MSKKKLAFSEEFTKAWKESKASCPTPIKSGVEIIETERKRQIEEERHEPAHDDSYVDEQLAYAATAYVMPLEGKHIWGRRFWPWGRHYFKPCIDYDDVEGRVHELAKAGALIAAEIDRLQRTLNKE